MQGHVQRDACPNAVDILLILLNGFWGSIEALSVRLVNG